MPVPNQFYIEPAGNISQGLSGLGSILNQVGEKRRARELQEQQIQQLNMGKEFAIQAMRSGDPAKMREVAVNYPEYMTQVMDAAEAQTGIDAQTNIDFTRQMLSSPPEEVVQLYQDRIQGLRDRGRDSSDTERSMQEYVMNPEQKILESRMAYAGMDPEGSELFEASVADPQVNREFKSADEIGVRGAQLITFGNGDTAFVAPDGVEISDPVERAEAISRELIAEVEQRGDIAQTESSAAARASRISGAFEQVGQIRTNNSILDEVVAAIDNGANTGLIASRFPTWNSATQVLRNAGNRLGLGVVSSVTFGALSEGELRLAKETALPTDLDQLELRQWVIDRQAAQNKIASQLESYIYFSERGGKESEWLENQKGIYRQRQIDTRFGGGELTPEEIEEVLDYEEANGIRY